MSEFVYATGTRLRPEDLSSHGAHIFHAKDHGLVEDMDPVKNTAAVNAAIRDAANAEGGGTVIIPKGSYPIYTIRMQSHVTLHLEKGAVLRAARCDVDDGYERQTGEGGQYDEPEVNLYEGLQDNGHSYFANSLIYGADLTDIAITGEGMYDSVLDGSSFHEKDGPDYFDYILLGGDPIDNDDRTKPGYREQWFGNKGIALVRCDRVVFRSFAVLIGGHFAIITEGCTNLYVDGIMVDTNRDAFDIDCCQNVTVTNSIFNSLNDDALCLKASFGAGRFMPVRNICLENCTVCGYDPGSVFAGVYTEDKQIAVDRCGPTGRVKFGTEATCGCDTVIARNIRFKRSRGFCLEACDTSSMHDILFEDCIMDKISSSPFYIRLGERGRFPVTGFTKETKMNPEGDVRLDNRNWILPNTEAFQKFPAQRYTPSYNRTKVVSPDGTAKITVVDPEHPCRGNLSNFEEVDGHYYLRRWDAESGEYVADRTVEIAEKDLPLYANAVGSAAFPSAWNIIIRNVKVTNADPRYPILLHGLADSRIRDVTIENVSVEYRGGMTMDMATEQRQLNTWWEYSTFHAPMDTQTLPWGVNTFFSKNEGLLPRADWNAAEGKWEADPYNVPEMPGIYPEPSNWGILPSYGIYAAHVENLALSNVHFETKVFDERHVAVIDDADGVTLHNVSRENGTVTDAAALAAWQGDPAAEVEEAVPVALVTDHFRRPTNLEYVPDYPYHTTTVENFTCEPGLPTCEVEIFSPAPGTPPDALYAGPTLPVPENGYELPCATDKLPLPRTVFRPYLEKWEAPLHAVPGEAFTANIRVRDPAGDEVSHGDRGIAYSDPDSALGNNPVVPLQPKDMKVTAALCWNDEGGSQREILQVTETGRKGYYQISGKMPEANVTGEIRIEITMDDGLIPETGTIQVRESAEH